MSNAVNRSIEKYSAARYAERHAFVTSYNPKTYLAKVVIQPGGQESGWLSIETSHVGNGFGDLVGLTPGSGGDSGTSGSTSSGGGTSGGGKGDQVIVRPQEGDFESFKIVQRVHNDDNVPPVVQQGEMLHPFFRSRG